MLMAGCLDTISLRATPSWALVVRSNLTGQPIVISDHDMQLGVLGFGRLLTVYLQTSHVTSPGLHELVFEIKKQD